MMILPVLKWCHMLLMIIMIHTWYDVWRNDPLRYDHHGAWIITIIIIITSPLSVFSCSSCWCYHSMVNHLICFKGWWKRIHHWGYWITTTTTRIILEWCVWWQPFPPILPWWRLHKQYYYDIINNDDFGPYQHLWLLRWLVLQLRLPASLDHASHPPQHPPHSGGPSFSVTGGVGRCIRVTIVTRFLRRPTRILLLVHRRRPVQRGRPPTVLVVTTMPS